MLLSSNLTDLGEVFIPCPFNQSCILLDYVNQLMQGCRIKTMANCEFGHWMQPKFRLPFATSHVNMQRLSWIALIGIKEKSESFVSKDNGHFFPCNQ
jgi:hypothetical protein